jgi:hypothetical protein
MLRVFCQLLARAKRPRVRGCSCPVDRDLALNLQTEGELKVLHEHKQAKGAMSCHSTCWRHATLREEVVKKGPRDLEGLVKAFLLFTLRGESLHCIQQECDRLC